MCVCEIWGQERNFSMRAKLRLAVSSHSIDLGPVGLWPGVGLLFGIGDGSRPT